MYTRLSVEMILIISTKSTDHPEGQLITVSSSGNRSTGPVLRGPGDQHVGAPDRDGHPRRLQHLAHSAPLSGHCLH